MNPKLALSVFALLCVAASPAVGAESEADYCRRMGTDDVRRPLPASLVPAMNRAFGLDLPPDKARRLVSWRCMNGRVYACAIGANRNCGRADAQVVPTPEAAAWCRQNADSPFVPAYVTGHDTIWKWRCTGRKATIEAPAFTVDARGFTAENWQPLD